MGWLTVAVGAHEIHVLPCDERERLVLGHRPSLTCFCQPTPQRDGPLDDPVWSHNEPSWPSATPQRLN